MYMVIESAEFIECLTSINCRRVISYDTVYRKCTVNKQCVHHIFPRCCVVTSSSSLLSSPSLLRLRVVIVVVASLRRCRRSSSGRRRLRRCCCENAVVVVVIVVAIVVAVCVIVVVAAAVLVATILMRSSFCKTMMSDFERRVRAGAGGKFDQRDVALCGRVLLSI